MDAVLCLREATHFQSMELERAEAICGLESGTRPRLWSTRGGCASRREVAFFGLRSAGTEIGRLIGHYPNHRSAGVVSIGEISRYHSQRQNPVTSRIIGVVAAAEAVAALAAAA
jgi:hypothetical protein